MFQDIQEMPFLDCDNDSLKGDTPFLGEQPILFIIPDECHP
jgi:hypothetical protein